MSYLARLKREKPEKALLREPTKPTKAPSVSSVSDPGRGVSRKTRSVVFEYALAGEPGPLVLVCPPGSDLAHALQRLEHQFGPDRVIAARPHTTTERDT